MSSTRETARTILRGVCLEGVARWMGATLVALLICIPVFPQANLGDITGRITDQSGGVIVGAAVTVTDTQRGVARTLIADKAGAYNAPNLTPGTYMVRAAANGFKPVQREDIVIEVGQQVRVDLTLQPGTQQQTITVTGAPPMVETTNTTLGGTLNNQTISELPLIGRNFVNLLTLRPGMQVYPGGGTYTRSANGTRADDIGYLVDGLSADEPYSGQSALNAPIAAGDVSSSLPVDAIQEFNTEQNPKAEFGWKPGAIVNAGLKSGTNAIHGSAFAFGRNDAMDARNYFNPVHSAACTTVPEECMKAPHSLEQFGATLGGPIVKDKLFYFVAYEGQRYTVGQVNPVSTPMTVSCIGGAPGCGGAGANAAVSLVDACNAVGRANVAPLSALLAGLPANSCVPTTPNYTPGPSESFFPQNNGASASNNVVLNLLSNNQQDNGVAKVDYHINDHHQLNGMYFNGHGGGIWQSNGATVGIPGQGNSPWQDNLNGFAQMGSGAWTWTPNSVLVNEFRGGYTYYRQPYLSVDDNVNPVAYGINTGITDSRFFGFPLLQLQGFGIRFGGNWPKIKGPNTALQFLDHVSILHGNHSFMFGGEVIRNEVTSFISSNGKGRLRFQNLTQFLEGVMRSGNSGVSALEVGDPTRHFSDQQYAAFVQDDWRITPRVTLNLGLRYELMTVLKERNNLLGNFDPTTPTGLLQVGYQISSPLNGDHNNFSPRLGVAWDVRGNGKTVVRAGGSIMYEYAPVATFADLANALGLSRVPTGATNVYCSTDPCVSGTSAQVTQAGFGTVGVTQVSIKGTNGLNAGWQAQTSACLFTTNCGPIIPSNIAAVSCGDGLAFTPAGSATPVADPPPCNIESADRNLRSPYISTWTLNVEQAFTNNLSLQAGYVGTHGTKLLGLQDINQPPLGSANPQTSRPYFSKFPYLGEIAELKNIDFSNYNALQLTLTERASHGLSFLAGYTWAHALDEASSNWSGFFVPPDSNNPRFLYGNSPFDIRHRFTFSATYELPGRSSRGQLLEGWSISNIVTVQTGQPWEPTDMSNDFAENGQINDLATYGQPWNFFGKPSDFTSGPNPIPYFTTNFPAACVAHAALADLQQYGCYMKGSSVLVPPAAGTVGNAGRGIFRDSGFRDWDLAVAKNWKFTERLNAQFRAEFFNVLNHPSFANPGGPAAPGWNDPSATSTFGCGCGTPDQVAPNPVLGSGGPRSIQLGLKLLW